MWCAPQQASMATMHVGNLPASSTSLSRLIRRRNPTAPEPSRPTMLHTFLPRSIPSTATSMISLLHSNLRRGYTPEGGAGHPISFPGRLEEIAQEKGIDASAIEVWFADEARIGQKNKISRRWARRGTRPSAPHDQRTASAYIFGAICPRDGKGAGLVMPRCDSAAMSLHLAEIAQEVSPGAHAVLILDQAGWHMSKSLVVPQNITLIPLPPKCPELNPVENVWQFMRDNWLSNRVFQSYTDILDHCCYAWNKLTDHPWRIMSLGLRDWTHRF